MGDRVDEPGRAARGEAGRCPLLRLDDRADAGRLREVDLLFDNSDGAWPDLPYSEVSVARRLHRGGEGQYLVNKTAVRRLDLVELLSDVGLGGGLRSVISQGRVETVLNSKPSERRELIEEAAGLGRFKRRRHRAELKLARVAVQVDRARDLEDEVKKRLRPLALQATAAERAEKLRIEISRLQAAIATLDLARLAERRAEAEGRRAATAEERRALDEQIAALVAEREQAEEELTDSAGAREQATAALYRLRSGGERIQLRRESATALAGSLRADLAAARAYDPSASAELEQAARAAAATAQTAAGERARLQVEAEERWARVAAVERHAQAAAAAQLDDVLGRRSETESLLTGGGRDALLALRGATQLLGVRHESSQRLLTELHSELGDAQRTPRGPSPAELGRAADNADAAARTAVREREDLDARVRLARERLAALEQSLAEREGLPPAARALAEQGEQLALQALEVEAGRERSVAAALGYRAAAVLVADAARGLELIVQAQSSGLGPVIVLVGRDPRELADLPVVPRDELLASTVRRGHRGRDRLGPGARRALVRRRDRRGAPAGARRSPPRAARRGGAACRARRRGSAARRRGGAARTCRRRGVRAGRAPAQCAPRRPGAARTARRRRGAARRDPAGCRRSRCSARGAARRARRPARRGSPGHRGPGGRPPPRGGGSRHACARRRAARERPHGRVGR